MRFAIPVVVAALLVLSGCDNSNDSEKNHQADHAASTDHPSTDNQSAARPAPPAGKLASHMKKLERGSDGCTGDNCPAVSIQWEQFDGQQALNEAIRRQLVNQLSSNRESGQPAPKTLQGAARAFLDISDTLPDGADDNWQLTGKAKRLGRHGDLLTVEISSYEFTGGAHGLPATHWLNWDLARNKAVPLTDALQPGKEKAFWDLARKAHQQWLEDEADADDDFRQAWPFQKTADYRLGKDGVVLLYQVYTIGPYVMGEPQLTIPWDQAKAVIRQGYQPGQG